MELYTMLHTQIVSHLIRVFTRMFRYFSEIDDKNRRKSFYKLVNGQLSYKFRNPKKKSKKKYGSKLGEPKNYFARNQIIHV